MTARPIAGVVRDCREGPAGHGAAGVGLDLVHVPGLVEQVTRPGTVFAERVFTARERREARRRSEDTGSTEAEHLAARWAAKEAFIKAWSQALNTRAGEASAPVIVPDDVDWSDIEVVTDRWGRPRCGCAARSPVPSRRVWGRGAAGPAPGPSR